MNDSVSSKKLVYILNSYSESEASHFVHILHLLEVMAEQGCKIVLLIEKCKSLPDLKHPQIKVVSLHYCLPVIRHFELFFRIIRLIQQGYRNTFVRIAAPASIITSLAHHLFGGHSYLWQSGTTHEHDRSQPLSFKKLKWWFKSYIPNYFARKLVYRFVTGPEAMVDYYAEVVKIPRSKITLLYNDIQIERFSKPGTPESRSEFLTRYNANPDSLVLLLVHRLSPVRRTLDYLEPMLTSFATQMDNRAWVLVIAGAGSELPRARYLVENLGLSKNILFLGDVPNRDIPHLYSISDIFVHPTFTEGFPRVLIEAMAAGLPIVSTDAGGTRQLLGHEQLSFVVDKAKPDEFAQRTIELINQPEKWPVLANENWTEVQRFSTPAVAAMYLEALFS